MNDDNEIARSSQFVQNINTKSFDRTGLQNTASLYRIPGKMYTHANR